MTISENILNVTSTNFITFPQIYLHFMSEFTMSLIQNIIDFVLPEYKFFYILPIYTHLKSLNLPCHSYTLFLFFAMNQRTSFLISAMTLYRLFAQFCHGSWKFLLSVCVYFNKNHGKFAMCLCSLFLVFPWIMANLLYTTCVPQHFLLHLRENVGAFVFATWQI